MASLLISKVNDIKVVQVGESKLSIENKSEDGGKVGGSKKIGFVGDGINKTIDLGKGKKKYTLKLFVFGRNENDALFKIFYEDRYCTIVDKFKGKIKVYIDSIDIIDSDKHVNRTIYDISCTVQDLDKSPSINFAVKLTSTVTLMEDELAAQVSQLTSFEEGSFESKVDIITNTPSFVDSALDILRTGVDSILDVKSKAFEAYTALKAKIDTGKRLFESIKNLKDFPKQFLNLISNITKDDTTNLSLLKTSSSATSSVSKINNSATSSVKTSDSVTSSVLRIGNVQKTQITPIFEPIIRGKPLSLVDTSKISQIEALSLKKEIIASQLVNKIKVIKDIKSILGGGFNSQEDFESTVNAIVQRLNYIGYTEDNISDKVYIIKSFANSQNYRDIVEIDISRKQPLVRLIFNRYGNLDNYYQIESLNNFKDNDSVSGKVKVFA